MFCFVFNHISSEFSTLFIKFPGNYWSKAVHKLYINKVNGQNLVLLEGFLCVYVCVLEIEVEIEIEIDTERERERENTIF